MDISIADADRVLGESDERVLTPWFPLVCEPSDTEPVVRERLADHLQPPAIRERFRRAMAARSRPGAETERRGIRVLAELYLARVSSEADLELGRLRASCEVDAGRLEAEWALASDPAERDERFNQWLALENLERETFAARSEMRNDGARSVTASTLEQFLGAGHPVEPSGVAAAFERGAIEPLDDVIESVAVASANAFGIANGPGRSAWIDLLSPARIVCIVRRAGSLFGEDPDTQGPSLSRTVGDRLLSRSGLTRAGEALLLPGMLPGPRGLMDLLGGFGMAARAGRLARLRGTAAVRCSDSAYPHAAQTLWRRLLLCPAFRADHGLELNDAELRQLAFHDAVAMRLAWAYLYSVDAGITPHQTEFDRVIRRATAQAPTPAHRRVAWDGAPSGACELRGTVLGLLLEENLRLQFGRRWLGHPAARRKIVEMWEAEPDLTAEEMAGSLDLGTIEPTPIVDASRGMIGN